MNTLGILGLGTKSTVYYIEKLNQQYNAVFGGYSTCPFILLNADFNTINPHLPDKFEILKKVIIPLLHHFEQLKVTHLLIPNITLHQTIDFILLENRFTFKIIHPLELLVKHLIKSKINDVTVLGSWYTMNGDYIQNVLLQNKVKVSSLDSTTKTAIDTLRKKIYNGEAVLDCNFYEIVEHQCPKSIPILACTELAIPKNQNPKIVDLVQLQIETAIQLLNAKKENDI